MEIEKKICYICNPSLNSSCGKGGCGWINPNGECFLTSDEDCALRLGDIPISENNGECFLTSDEDCALRLGDIPISENVVVRLINSVTGDTLISRKI